MSLYQFSYLPSALGTVPSSISQKAQSKVGSAACDRVSRFFPSQLTLCMVPGLFRLDQRSMKLLQSSSISTSCQPSPKVSLSALPGSSLPLRRFSSTRKRWFSTGETSAEV